MIPNDLPKEPRICAEENSPIYVGTIKEAAPPAKPVTTRPMTNIEKFWAATLRMKLYEVCI